MLSKVLIALVAFFLSVHSLMASLHNDRVVLVHDGLHPEYTIRFDQINASYTAHTAYSDWAPSVGDGLADLCRLMERFVARALNLQVTEYWTSEMFRTTKFTEQRLKIVQLINASSSRWRIWIDRPSRLDESTHGIYITFTGDKPSVADVEDVIKQCKLRIFTSRL